MKLLIYHPRHERYARLVRAELPDLDVVAGFDLETLHRHLPDADLMICWHCPLEALRGATKLRWIQLTSAGAEHLVPARPLLRHVVVTNGRGVHGDVMADYTIGVIVLLQWGFVALWRSQQQHLWKPQSTETIVGKTLGVVGLGSIGGTIARRAQRFGMRVLAVKRRPVRTRGGIEVVTPERMGDVLAAADFVVLTVPGIAETHHLIGGPELRRMKPTSYLINVSRGSVVDEAALILALQQRWIAGAALDVFETEPLPANSPLWAMDNVVVTPHIAGEPADYVERLVGIFRENYGRWKAGKRLRNVTDLSRGY